MEGAMRIPVPVYVGAVAAAAVVSTILWRDLQASRQALQDGQQALQSEQQALQAERQLSESLRAQLDQARAELASRQSVQPAAAAATATAPAIKIPTQEELVAQIQNSARRQKALLDTSDFHKARLAEVRTALKRRYPLLAREVGVSEQEADKILDLMAESQLRKDAMSAELLAGANPADPAAMAELERQHQAREQAQDEEDKNTLVGMLGTARYEKLQYAQETQAAHTRIINLKTLLAQGGQPLTDDQMLSLTRVVAEEQKLEEKESQDLRANGQYRQVSQVDRAAQGDRRILDNASGFLSPQQLQTIRTRFEQRQAMERASGNVQTRERGQVQISASQP
jgi:hypothetical protein